MSTVTAETQSPTEVAAVPYEITADEFFHLIETGFFPTMCASFSGTGGIYRRMSKTGVHGVAASLFNEALMDHVRPAWHIMTEGQFKLDPTNSPLPDLLIVRGRPRDYLNPSRYPEAGDIGLVIEIAVSGRKLLIHTRPRVVDGKGEYQQVEAVSPGGSIALVLDGREVARLAYEDLMP